MLNSKNIIISEFAINALQTKNAGFPLNLPCTYRSQNKAFVVRVVVTIRFKLHMYIKR
jgi:hypothetical protein